MAVTRRRPLPVVLYVVKAAAVLIVLGVVGVGRVAGDASADLYAVQCAKAFSKALKSATSEIEALKNEVTEGRVVEDFGARADAICNNALTIFSNEAPDADKDPIKVGIHDKQVEELERTLDPPLHVLFIRQLLLIREKALQRYKTEQRATESTDYDAAQIADSFFTQEAESCLRKGSDWDYAAERQSLQNTMRYIAAKNKALLEEKLRVREEQVQQNRQLEAKMERVAQMQAAMSGGGSPLQFMLAYRVPDTNFNVQWAFQQGRNNIQISCVPDEQMPFLGPQGFTQGIGPGNLGVTVNLNV